MTKHFANKDDIKIGLRFRQARVEYGFTQTEIAKHFMISAQQIQKFESGQNLVSARMLYNMTKLCQKPMDWFTQDLEYTDKTYEGNLMPSAFILNITSIIRQIVSTTEQKKILNIVKACVANL